MCWNRTSRRPWRQRLGLCVGLAAILGGAARVTAEDPAERGPGPVSKKLIEWGWDEPDPAFVRQHIEEMRKTPFDGFVFHLNSSHGGNFLWEMWGGRRFELEEFQHAIADMQNTSHGRLTERFLRINVTPGDVDWFDEERWKNVLHNCRVAAQVAHAGGCRGLMFDVEQYQGKLFDSRAHASRPFEETASQVRRRGREWMRTVQEVFPSPVILLTFAYATAQRSETGMRSNARYGLLADFLDGMLEECEETTKIVDAWEPSYAYQRKEQFDQAYDVIKNQALAWTGVPGKYQTQVQAGFGLWMDDNWQKQGWHTDDVSQNYFSPEKFETALRAAFETSDKYVWIYTEQPRWWPREKLPEAYVEAVRAARDAQESQPAP